MERKNLVILAACTLQNNFEWANLWGDAQILGLKYTCPYYISYSKSTLATNVTMTRVWAQNLGSHLGPWNYFDLWHSISWKVWHNAIVDQRDMTLPYTG